MGVPNSFCYIILIYGLKTVGHPLKILFLSELIKSVAQKKLCPIARLRLGVRTKSDQLTSQLPDDDEDNSWFDEPQGNFNIFS